MPEPSFFLGCDWGSTSFRLRRVEFGSRRVLDEFSDAKGVRAFTGLTAVDRAAAMARFLGESLARWPDLPAEVPLIISGMATSTVGWIELPYAHTPFRLDGSDCRVARAEFTDPHGGRRHALLVSGVRTEDDILRGEECILAGVHALRPAPDGRRTLALLAGTHPKHALLEGGRLVSFRTHLTGELFEAVSTATLLAASIDRAATQAAPDLAAFREGVSRAQTEGLTAALFQVRARQVLHGVSGGANTWFLSGLLIGVELERLARHPPDAALLLVGEDLRVALYQEALRVLGLAPGGTPLPSLPLAAAVIAGHEAILRRHLPP